MQRLPLATAFLTGSSAATVRWTPSSARAALVEPSFFLRFLSVVVRAGTPALLLLALTPAWGEIRGAARLSRPRQATLTWGTRLELWPDTGGKPRVLLRGTDFGPGGCVADVDGDGRDDLLVQEHPGASRMLWLKAPRWTATVVEPETDFHDCLEFTLDGRRGVLVPHFHAQLRLYLFPKFDYKELYSIYTASEQGGLLAHDVDGDGLEDLFIGNYWMRNPGRLDVAWRLFACERVPRYADGRARSFGPVAGPHARLGRDDGRAGTHRGLHAATRPEAALAGAAPGAARSAADGAGAAGGRFYRPRWRGSAGRASWGGVAKAGDQPTRTGVETTPGAKRRGGRFALRSVAGLSAQVGVVAADPIFAPRREEVDDYAVLKHFDAM